MRNNKSPKQKSAWINHSVYFFFWLFVGFFAWSFSFDGKNGDKKTHVTQLSSVRDDEGVGNGIDGVSPKNDPEDVDLSETNYQEMQSLSDDQLRALLEDEKAAPEKDENPYALDAEQIENLGNDSSGDQSDFENGVRYSPIAGPDLKIQVEDPKDAKACPAARLYYEKQLAKSSKIKDLLETRPDVKGVLPRLCLIHVMNNVGLGRSSLGVCGRAAGAVHIPGNKPCVTDNLVNATYNSFVDVMDCLNLNEKTFFPKISRESGFMLNAFGVGKDGGIGQLTQPAIEEVNKVYPQYMSEIEKAAATKPSCARIMKHKDLLAKAPPASNQRCSMIGVPENPLRNILYLGIFNRSNMDQFSGIKYLAGHDYLQKDNEMIPVKNDASDVFGGTAKANKYQESLEELGIKNPNMHFFKEVITLASYNMGGPTALRLFSLYLQKRKQAKKMLTPADFDFNKQRPMTDVYGDGKTHDAVEIAKSFVLSSFISKRDKKPAVAAKLKKRKLLPREWASSYLKSFPEFLAYNANSYNGKQITRFSVYGDPGYVSFVAQQNRNVRNAFNDAGQSPDFCSDPNFLTFK